MICIGVVALFALIGATNGKARKVTAFETIITDVFTGPQRMFTYFKKWVTKDKDFFSDVEELKTENAALKAENEDLKRQMTDYELIVSENTTLKEHAKMQDDYADYEIVVAEVISDGSNNWEKTYIINKGSKNGVAPNMPVITSAGLVGYIETVTASTAKVVSIIDAGNSVSGRVTRTRDAVICQRKQPFKRAGKA